MLEFRKIHMEQKYGNQEDHVGRAGDLTYVDGFLFYHDGTTVGGLIINGAGSDAGIGLGGGAGESVSWNQLADVPDFATVSLSGSYHDLTHTPVLALVATSGSYADLLNKPTIPQDLNQLTDDTGLLSGTAVSWATLADKNNGSGPTNIALGNSAGMIQQGADAVAIGVAAGLATQATTAVAIGWRAGADHQSEAGVALGSGSGQTTQGQRAVALGENAGNHVQGDYAIALGANAGFESQPANTIILNATGAQLNGVAEQTNSLYMAPVRNDATNVANALYYNASTNEVTYGSSSAVMDIVKTIAAASTDFADFKARIAAL